MTTMKRLPAFVLGLSMSCSTFAQQALWSTPYVVSPQVNNDNTVKFRLKGLGEATEAVESTGIETMTATNNDDADGQIFNLAGQRLQKARKGINIIGGKKVVVK